MGHFAIEGGEFFDRGGIRPNEGIDLDCPVGPDVRMTLDPTDLVIPGLVDIHCHVGAGSMLGGPRSWEGRYAYGVSQSECLVSGVVACADAGTFGPNTVVEAAIEWNKDPFVQVRSWIFLYGDGLHDAVPIPDADEICGHLEEAVSKIPDVVIGIKIRLGRGDASQDELLLERACIASDRLSLPLMVHLTGSRLGAGAACDMLRNGDVLTHAFHGREGNILGSDGRVLAAVVAAEARGVKLDVGPGAHHFSWEVLDAAIESGALPDTVSSDLTYFTWRSEPICTLPTVISQVVAGGISLERALYGASYGAADLIGVDLSAANGVVVLRRDTQHRHFADSHGAARAAQWNLRVVAVVSPGNNLIHYPGGTGA